MKTDIKKMMYDLAEKKGEDKKRLFLDMDGMLAEYRTFENEEQYLQPGYYISLKPHTNVIDAIKKLIATEPNIEIFTLSAYFDVPGAIAEKEKNEWLDKYLPEIDSEHRIFTACGQPKQNYIKGGISENDYLMDDYTRNLEMWEEGGGKGIKLLNGINGRIGKWEGPKISYKKSPDEIAKSIVDVIYGQQLVKDVVNECQLRNEKQGLTMYIEKDRLAQIVNDYFPEYENVDDFRSNFTLEHWRFVKRLEPKAEVRENTSVRQFAFELKTFSDKFYDKLEILRRSSMEQQIDAMKNKMKLEFILKTLQTHTKPKEPAVALLSKDSIFEISRRISEEDRKFVDSTVNEIRKNFTSSYEQWSEYKEVVLSELRKSVSDFLAKYDAMSTTNKKAFSTTVNAVKTDMLADLQNIGDVMNSIDAKSYHEFKNIIGAIDAEITKRFDKQVSHTFKSVAEDVFEEKPSNPSVSLDIDWDDADGR